MNSMLGIRSWWKVWLGCMLHLLRYLHADILLWHAIPLLPRLLWLRVSCRCGKLWKKEWLPLRLSIRCVCGVIYTSCAILGLPVNSTVSAISVQLAVGQVQWYHTCSMSMRYFWGSPHSCSAIVFNSPVGISEKVPMACQFLATILCSSIICCFSHSSCIVHIIFMLNYYESYTVLSSLIPIHPQC